MPIGMTLLVSGSDMTNATSYTTASITPTADRLIEVNISSKDTDPPNPTVTGNGITYTLEEVTANANAGRKVWKFRGMSASPSAGAITIDYGAGNTQVRCLWIVAEFDTVDTSGTNGSGAVLQSVPATSGSAASLAITLAAFGDATNNAVSAAYYVNAAQSITEESGYTEIAEVVPAEAQGLEAEWKIGEDLSVTASTSPNAAWGGIAIEIKAAAAGPDPDVLMAARQGGIWPQLVPVDVVSY